MSKTLGQRNVEKLKRVLNDLERVKQQNNDLEVQASVIIKSRKELSDADQIIDLIVQKALELKTTTAATGENLEAVTGHLAESAAVLKDIHSRYVLADVITVLQNELEFVKGDHQYSRIYLDNVDIPVFQQELIVTDPHRRSMLIQAVKDIEAMQ